MSTTDVQNEGMSLEQLLGATLGDLPDLNAVPPEGTYQASIKFAIKDINGVNAIEATYTIQEVIEVDNPEVKPAKKGDKFTELFMTNSDVALGRFKELLGKIEAATGASSVADALQGGPYQSLLVLKHRKDKKDPTIIYPKVAKLELI